MAQITESTATPLDDLAREGLTGGPSRLSPELLRRFIHSKVRIERDVSRMLQQAFRGAPVSSDILEGMKPVERVHDSLLIAEALARIQHAPPNRPVSVLGIGDGSTLGRGGDYNSPWTLRALADAFRSETSVIASDISRWSHVFMARNGTIRRILLVPPDMPHPLSPLRMSPSGAVLFDPIPPRDIAERFADFLAHVRWTIDLMPVPEDFDLSDGLFVLPDIHAPLERALFNLDFRFDVNYMRLAEHFPGERFDVIVGRHLDCDSGHRGWQGNQALLESVGACLKPGGVALISGTSGYARTPFYLETGVRVSTDKDVALLEQSISEL